MKVIASSWKFLFVPLMPKLPCYGSKLTKVIISVSNKSEVSKIEKVKQIAKKIRNIELLVESENVN